MPWSYDGPAHPVRARDPVAPQNLVASQARPGEEPSTRTTWGPRPVASLWHEDLWRHLAPVRCRKAASRSLSSIGVNATELQVYPARHGTLSHGAASSAHLQRQTSSDATRAGPVFAQGPFFRPGERWPPRVRRRRAMAVEPLAPPAAARIATRIVACVATHGAACVDTCSATVYTNDPKRAREAIFTNLCTLLRPHVCPQWRNSVHKCPKTDPRGHFRQSVYTPASPTHGRPRDRAGSRVPRRQRPHGTRDARALGPEDHAAGAMTQPATHTSS